MSHTSYPDTQGLSYRMTLIQGQAQKKKHMVKFRKSLHLTYFSRQKQQIRWLKSHLLPETSCLPNLIIVQPLVKGIHFIRPSIFLDLTRHKAVFASMSDVTRVSILYQMPKRTLDPVQMEEPHFYTKIFLQAWAQQLNQFLCFLVFHIIFYVCLCIRLL